MSECDPKAVLAGRLWFTGPGGSYSAAEWQATRDSTNYQAFIQASRAELGFAKAMYAETRSGWFSDRTQCYLASGRPALVRDTGFGRFLPVDKGLLAFDDEAQILEGMDEIDGDYERHSRRARELAGEYFEAGAVVQDRLEMAGVAA